MSAASVSTPLEGIPLFGPIANPPSGLEGAFSELLSTAAAGLGAAGRPTDTGIERAAPAPLAATPGATGGALPASDPSTGGYDGVGPAEAAAEATSDEWPLSAAQVRPWLTPSGAALGEAALEHPEAPRAASPASPADTPPTRLLRPLRPRASAVSESGEPDGQDLPPVSCTMQQALAAVAAIVLVKGAPPASSAASSGTPAAPAASAVAEAPTIAGSGPLRAKPAALPVAGDSAALNDGTASMPSLDYAPTNAPAVDAQILGAGLPHAKLAVPAGYAPAVHTVDASTDPELQQLDALMRDIASVSGASGRAAFRLTAEQLGPMEVRLHSSDAGVAVTIRTHDDHSRTTVSQAQQQLTDDMRANGLKVAATNVTVGGGGGDRQPHDRPHAPAALPIEASLPDADRPQLSNKPRLDGRYA